MTFGDMLELVKEGGKATRDGWIDNGLYHVGLHPGWDGGDEMDDMYPFLYFFSSDANEMVAYLPNMYDLLAEDWKEYPTTKMQRKLNIVK